MKEVALITGASSGIGTEFAKIHAQKGRDLVLVARREARLLALKTELISKYQVEVEIIVQDLSEIDGAEKVYQVIKERGIQISYLINNAGFGGQGLFHERDLNQETAMINVNIMALTKLTHLFIPDLLKQDQGRILNVASVAALMPGPMQSVYFASKAYVHSFSLGLSEELKATNVTVTALLPGATKTEFAEVANAEDTDLFKNKLYAPSTVALDGYMAMEKGKREVVTGVNKFAKFGLKLLPLIPKQLVLKQTAKMQTKK